jgi:hypothetical protein
MNWEKAGSLDTLETVPCLQSDAGVGNVAQNDAR